MSSKPIVYGQSSSGRDMVSDVSLLPNLFCPGCGLRGIYKVGESDDGYSAVFCITCKLCCYLDVIPEDTSGPGAYNWPIEDRAALSAAIRGQGPTTAAD